MFLGTRGETGIDIQPRTDFLEFSLLDVLPLAFAFPRP